MCGIVGGVAERSVAPILLEGLRRLEYRGYDSAGMLVLDADHAFQRLRRMGKVEQLAAAMDESPLNGCLGIAHTGWATHGEPSAQNAHPHVCNDRVALVHNGIIENHGALRDAQREQGYRFSSDTDTETIVHQIEHYLQSDNDLLSAVQSAVSDLQGAYSLGVIDKTDANHLVAVREGSPLVIGVGFGEYFIASDVMALLPVTQRFIFLKEGDVADIRPHELCIYDADGKVVERAIEQSSLSADTVSRGGYRHFMMKEIHEQPNAIVETMEGRLLGDSVLPESLGNDALDVLEGVEHVQIIACGTSYHSGLVARYWFESLLGLPCSVEVASEYRYRQTVNIPNTLFITISQSGETADTLAALRLINKTQARTLAICNVAESSLVRESAVALMTRAGPEVGVASTKAFTTQLAALMVLLQMMAKVKSVDDEILRGIREDLAHLPALIEQVLAEKIDAIEAWNEAFKETRSCLFLGRGSLYPIAMEGALKLKEISYIHAEAYAAGELKHGPLALIDNETPVIAILANDGLQDKIKSNLQEVLARNGVVYAFVDESIDVSDVQGEFHVIKIPSISAELAPILYAIPLQLLSYYVAVMKGTDVDQPRNLAKSVTVE